MESRNIEQNQTPPPPDTRPEEGPNPLIPLREEIDRIDASILELINRRLAIGYLTGKGSAW